MLHCIRRFGVPSIAATYLRQLSSKRPPSAAAAAAAVIPSQLLDLLVCPLSKDQLVQKNQSLQSQAAGIAYPIIHVNDHTIVNMIPRDATLLLDENETV